MRAIRVLRSVPAGVAFSFALAASGPPARAQTQPTSASAVPASNGTNDVTIDPKEEAARLASEARALLEQPKPNLKAARARASAALKLDSSNLEARLIRGLATKRMGDTKQYAQARKDLESVRKRAPNRKGVALDLAELLESLKDGAAAAPQFLDAARETQAPELALRAGRYAADAGNTDVVYAAFSIATGLQTTDLEKLAGAAETLGKYADARDTWRKLLAEKADSTTYALGVGRASVALKDVGSAQQAFEAVLAREPNSADALLGLADCARISGDASAEEALTRKAIESSPQHPSAQRRLGQLLAARGDTAGARGAFGAQLAVAPNDLESLLGLGRVELAEGAWERAVGVADQAAAAGNTKSPAVQHLRGRALLRGGRFDEAVNALRAAARALSTDAEVQLDLAEALAGTGSTTGALDLVRKVQAGDPTNARSHEVAGIVALRQGKKRLAAEAFRVALSGRATDPNLHVKVAQIYLSLGDKAAATPLLDKALALAPEHPEAIRERARLYVDAAAFDQALPLLERALEKRPDDVELLVALGQAQRAAAQGKSSTGQTQALQRTVDRILSIRPDDPVGNELAGLLLLDAARALGSGAVAAAWPQALPYLEKSLAGQPGHDALAVLAESRRQKGDRNAARQLLARVTEMPRPPDVLAQEAALELEEGRSADAEARINAALALAPEDPVALAIGGDVAHARANSRQARERYEGAITRGVLSPAQRGRYAATLAAEGAFDTALASAKQALAEGNDDGSVHATIAWCQFRTGEREAARASADTALAKGARSVSTRLILGELALADGRTNDARTEFEAALAIDAKDPQANAALGRLLANEGQYAKALPLLDIARKSLATDPATVAAFAQSCIAVGGRTTQAEEALSALPEGALDVATDASLRGQIAHQRGNFIKAAREFERAVAARPGDTKLLTLQADNYLKTPQYEKAISALEYAVKSDASRIDLGQRLTALYAESGQREKAAAAARATETQLAAEREAARQNLAPEQMKVVSVAETFKDDSPDGPQKDALSHLTRTLPAGLSGALAKVPAIQLLVRDDAAEVELEKQREAWAREHEDATPEEIAAAFPNAAKIAAYVVSGRYQVVPPAEGRAPTLVVTAQLLEVKGNRVARSATRSGALDDFGKLSNEVALELVGNVVPISAREREYIANSYTGGNLESMRLLAEAEELRRSGKLREATAVIKQARAADEGNIAAIEAFEKTTKELGTRNRVAVRDFTRIGDAPAWIEAGLQSTIASKLSNIEGIQVVDRSELPAVERELELWAQQNADAMESGTDEERARLTQEAESLKKTLPVGALVTGDYQLHGGVLVVNAKLTDLETKALMLSEQEAGPERDLIALQSRLAEKIARRLVGAPSEEEVRRLRERKEFDQYKREMEELAQRREAEKRAVEDAEAVKLAEAAQVPPSAPSMPSTPTTPTPTSGSTTDTSANSDTTSTAGHEAMRLRWMALSSSRALGLEYGFWTATDGDGDVEAQWVLGVQAASLDAGASVVSGAAGVIDGGLQITFPIELVGLHFHAGSSLVGGVVLGDVREIGAVKPELKTSAFVGARPRFGIRADVLDRRWTLDVGAQVNLLNWGDNTGGLFVQAGMELDGDRPSTTSSEGFVLQYRPRLLIPNGAQAAALYGSGYRFQPAGSALLVHDLFIGDRDGDFRDGILASVISEAGKLDGMGRLWSVEVSRDIEMRMAVDTGLLNPFVGGRIGLGVVAAPGLGDCDQICGSFSVGGRTGMAVKLIDGLELSTAGGYQLHLSGGPFRSGMGSTGDFSGWFFDLGLAAVL